MINWTREKLEANEYKLENAKITHVDMSMADHGVLSLEIGLKGCGWECVYGGYVIGKGYVGAEEFEGSASGIESIMRIMDVVGVSRFNDMKGKYVRVATQSWGDIIKIMGNITEDHWFDIKSFFEDKGE